MRTYIAIDLKSFYASVECVERGLDPLTTNLVVADASRTSKTICLAVSPSLKAYGLSGRSRLFEVEQKMKEIKYKTGKEIKYITAIPHMSLYMEYSANIYNIYKKYISENDIHVYSIDEVFMDVTEYLSFYKMSAYQLCQTIIQDVLQTTGITATAGIADNLYLCKVAMDIVAKHQKADQYGVRIAQIDEISYRKLLWNHTPLTDFWRIGKGISKRLEDHGLYTMGDIARESLSNEDWFYEEFGIDAEILIDHAWGYEPCTIQNIKQYKPNLSSISSGQVLSEPYKIDKARIIVREMAEGLLSDLIDKKLVTSSITLDIAYDRISVDNGTYRGATKEDFYGRKVPKSAHGSCNLETHTSSYNKIISRVMDCFDKIVNPRLYVRRVNIAFHHCIPVQESFEQLDLFSNHEQEQKDKQLQDALLDIQKKFGKGSVFKGTNLEEGSTLLERNHQIGGHKA